MSRSVDCALGPVLTALPDSGVSYVSTGARRSRSTSARHSRRIGEGMLAVVSILRQYRARCSMERGILVAWCSAAVTSTGVE
eukprot:2558098-Rhodomonas_salina.1